MKQIIEEVLQAEEKVGVVIKQAREKATEIRLAAEKEISEKMSQAREQAREIMQASLDNAKKEAERIREERLKQADREKDTFLENRADVIEALVDDICNIVLTTERQKDGK